MKKGIMWILVLISIHAFGQEFKNLEVGKTVLDFSLESIQGDVIQFSKLNEENRAVLIVLRGWPEYQCPLCSRQVGEFVSQADDFKKLGVKLVMVYPGPAGNLKKYAAEFAEDFEMPENFYFVIDPDYSMINKYGLRWEAPKETAYPSTFVIDKKGQILFSKISKTHGGRASVDEVLEALEKKLIHEKAESK